MKKILVTGYYGFENFGDDIFPYAASINFKGVRLCILSPEIPGVKGVKFLVPRLLSTLYAKNNWLAKALRMGLMIYGACLTRHVVLAGGSVLASDSSNRMRKLQYLLWKTKICKLSAIGVSVGPFTDNSDVEFYRKFVSALHNFFVRDLNSYRVSREFLGVEPELFGDLAGCLPSLGRKVHERKKNSMTLGVSLCEYPGVLSIEGPKNEIERENYDQIVKGLEGFSHGSNARIAIVELNSHPVMGDTRISQALFKDLSARGVEVSFHSYVNAKETLALIHGLDVFFTVRLHGAIAGYISKTKFLSLEYHDKCRDFLDYVEYEGPRIGRKVSADKVIESLTVLINTKSDDLIDDRRLNCFRQTCLQNFKRFAW